MSKIHLHIEKLVLPGYSQAEQHAFVAALKQELAKGLAGNNAEPVNCTAISIRSNELHPDALAQSVAPVLLPADRKKRGGQT